MALAGQSFEHKVQPMHLSRSKICFPLKISATGAGTAGYLRVADFLNAVEKASFASWMDNARFLTIFFTPLSVCA
jgi:hypothetical protein